MNREKHVEEQAQASPRSERLPSPRPLHLPPTRPPMPPSPSPSTDFQSSPMRRRNSVKSQTRSPLSPQSTSSAGHSRSRKRSLHRSGSSQKIPKLHVQRELLDVEVIKESSLFNTKPSHNDYEAARRGFLHLMFFPLYPSYWSQRGTRLKWSLATTVGVLQTVAMYIYFSSGPAAFKELHPLEVSMPLILLFICAIGYGRIQGYASPVKSKNKAGRAPRYDARSAEIFSEAHRDEALHSSDSDSSDTSSSTLSEDEKLVRERIEIERKIENWVLPPQSQHRVTPAARTFRRRRQSWTLEDREAFLQRKTPSHGSAPARSQSSPEPAKKEKRAFDFNGYEESPDLSETGSPQKVRSSNVRKTQTSVRHQENEPRFAWQQRVLSGSVYSSSTNLYSESEHSSDSETDQPLEPESKQQDGGNGAKAASYSHKAEGPKRTSSRPVSTRSSKRGHLSHAEEYESELLKNIVEDGATRASVYTENAVRMEYDQTVLNSDTDSTLPYSAQRKVNVIKWTESGIAYKVQMSVFNLRQAIIDKVRRHPPNNLYHHTAPWGAALIATSPCICRLLGIPNIMACAVTAITSTPSYACAAPSVTPGNSTMLPVIEKGQQRLEELVQTLFQVSPLMFGSSSTTIFISLSSMVSAFILSTLFLLELAEAETTYYRRYIYAKSFAALTSASRARRARLPHFRLKNAVNIKAWLSLRAGRAWLKKQGKQRAADAVVSSCFVINLLLVAFIMIQFALYEKNDGVELFSSLLGMEVLTWCAVISFYVLRFMMLGSRINKKYQNSGLLLTEQMNIYLRLIHSTNHAKKKESLMMSNNVLKIATKLLKELEKPNKVSGVTMNPFLYNMTRVLVLSAFSATISELLGFKLKIWKIKV